jgi:hypothetical protein
LIEAGVVEEEIDFQPGLKLPPRRNTPLPSNVDFENF